MNRGSIIKTLAFFLIAVLRSHGQEAGNPQQVNFPQWGFCMVYQLRDVDDDKDSRPDDPESKDPLGTDGTYVPYQILCNGGRIDVAALTNRMVKCALLKRAVSEKVIHDAVQGGKKYPIMECYDPHHVFVFFDYQGQPVGAIEVCFSCDRVQMSPEIRAHTGKGEQFETADLADLAKIASEAGLGLDVSPSLDAYLQRLDRIVKHVEEQDVPAGDNKPSK